MKKIFSYIKGSEGFALGYAMIISAIMLIVITAIVHLIPSRQAATFTTKYSNKAQYLADSGLQHALSQLRQHSTKPQGLAPINQLADGSNSKFEYRYRVSLSTVSLPQNSEQLYVSATSYGMVTALHLQKTTTRYAYAYIEVNSLLDYCLVSTKQLNIGAGLDIRDAKAYGYDLVFLSDGSSITRLKGADYHGSVTGDQSPLVEIGDPLQSGALAYWRAVKIDLPLISELFDEYKLLAATTYYYLPKKNGLLGDTDCSFNYSANLSGNIKPPKNGNSIYYAPTDITFGPGETKIDGQMIFITTNSIILKGDLKKKGMGDLVGLFAGKDVLIDKKNDTTKVAEDIIIQAVILASEGQFATDASMIKSATAKFDFTGAIMIRDGINISHIYETPGNRTYQYDTDLQTNNLPHMPFLANIIYYHAK